MIDLFTDPFAGSARTASPASASAVPKRPSRGRVPGEVGIWVFIVGDMLVFTLFFTVFSHARSQDPVVFEQSRRTLSLTFGAVNTLLLLTGSMLVVQGLHAVRRQATRVAPWMFFLAGLCGVAFIVDKAFEYSSKIDAGHTASSNNFYMYYFLFTGIHVLHLLLALVAITVMWRIARKPVHTAKDLRNLEAGACYWHLVDLLWIVLFPLFYLMR